MSTSTVYLGDLPLDTKEEELRRHLSGYGVIKSVTLRRGYGFVEFESGRDAVDVVNTFSRQSFMKSAVKVELARTKTRRKLSTEDTSANAEAHKENRSSQPNIRYPVIVDNLNRATCWQELKDFGKSFGVAVAYCDIDRKHRTRGFLEYLTQEDADRAVNELNGRELNGNVVSVTSCGPQKLLYKPRAPEGRNRSCSPTRPMRGMISGGHRVLPRLRSRSPRGYSRDIFRLEAQNGYGHREPTYHASPPRLDDYHHTPYIPSATWNSSNCYGYSSGRASTTMIGMEAPPYYGAPSWHYDYPLPRPGLFIQ